MAQRSLYWRAVIDAIHDRSKIPFTFSSVSMSDDCNDSLCSSVPSLNFSLQLPCYFTSDLSKENLLFSTLAKEIIWGWFSDFQNKPILIGCMLFSCLILLLVIIFWLLLILFLLSVLHVMVVDVMKFLKLSKLVLLDLHSIYVSLNASEKSLKSELFDAKRNSLLGKWQYAEMIFATS